MGKASTNIEDLQDGYDERPPPSTSQRVMADLKKITDNGSDDDNDDEFDVTNPSASKKSKSGIAEVLTSNASNSVLVFSLATMLLNPSYSHYLFKIPFISNYEPDSMVGVIVSALVAVIIFLAVKYILANMG